MPVKIVDISELGILASEHNLVIIIGLTDGIIRQKRDIYIIVVEITPHS